MSARIDQDLCETLVARGADGDASACRALVEHLWPAWIDIVKSSRSLREIGHADDVVHDVVAKLVEKIGRADGRGAKLYVQWHGRNPEKTFEDWIRIVTKNAIRDYLRQKLGPRNPTPGEPSLKRLLNEFASSPALEELGVRPPLTAAQTARELLEFARTRLPTDQLTVLGAWLEGASFEDMEKEHGMTAEDARKHVRAAVATLRRHFAPEETA